MEERVQSQRPHPLYGAELRAKRAKVHIRSLKRHLQRWTDAHEDFLEVKTDADGHMVDWTLRDGLPITDVLGRSGVWIGEAVFNLRAALDYLVYEIACTCNGFRYVDDTQFPSATTPTNSQRKLREGVPKRVGRVSAGCNTYRSR